MEHKYAELLNPSKSILKALINFKKPMRWSEIKRNLSNEISNDKVLKMGMDQLQDLNLIIRDKKEFSITYRVNERYKQMAMRMARKHMDELELENYYPSKLIDLHDKNASTTVYGLNSNIFYQYAKEGLELAGTKENFQFLSGMKSGELMGKTYAIPLDLKMRLKKDATEKEIIDAEVEYFSKVLKKIKNPEKIIREIIERYRKTPIDFEDIGGNIINKLLELKKEHRYSQIEETYKTLLAKLKKSELKDILKQYQKELLSIMNNMDIRKEWLKEIIIESKAEYTKAFKDNPKKQKKFSEKIEGINQEHRERLINFLFKVYEENKDLWPTRVMFLAKTK